MPSPCGNASSQSILIGPLMAMITISVWIAGAAYYGPGRCPNTASRLTVIHRPIHGMSPTHAAIRPTVRANAAVEAAHDPEVECEPAAQRPRAGLIELS